MGGSTPRSALIEVVAGGVALLAFVDWVFEPEGAATSRWILVLLIAVYVAAHLRAGAGRAIAMPSMINAAGLAGLVLAASFGGAFLIRSPTRAIPVRGGSS